MSDTKEPDDKTGAGQRKTITLGVKRTVEQGHVRQSFSHGRSKAVLVEKRRSAKPATTLQSAVAQDERANAPRPQPAAAPKPQIPQNTAGNRPRNVLKTLSADEVDARSRALIEARKRDEVDRVRREAEDAARREREAIEAAEAAERARLAPPPPPEPEPAPPAPAAAQPARAAPPSARPGAPARPGQPAARPGVAPRPGAAPARPGTSRPGEAAPIVARRNTPEDGEREKSFGAPKRPGGSPIPVKPRNDAVPKKPTTVDRSNRQRLTIGTALDDQQRERSLASLRRQRERMKKQSSVQEPRKKITREVLLPEVITIQELGNRMAERAVDIIKFLMKQGQMHKINDVIDLDTAELVVEEFGHTARRVSEADVEEGFIAAADDEGDTILRAPVVTIMGHVDHGKTSLLDALRKTSVVSGEAGGITQHIGAYQVTTPAGDPITFIDTPGHAAFTAMRARGAKVTDIVVLVVAADDGVMPQTIEAINHARAAKVPLIVAINKIDKHEADPTRVRTGLLQHEIVVESMSGDTLEVEVSAKTGDGLGKLLEVIGLQAEVLELRANPDRPAEGFVIEAKLERGRGPVGTVLVQRGTLRVGQIVVAGKAWGKIRALIDDQGNHIAEAGPSVPVEILGFDQAPEAGDQFAVVESEARARELTAYRVRRQRDVKAGGVGGRASLEQMMSQLGKAGKKEFALIVKGDVQGSVEAIIASLEKIGNDEVGARIIHSGVGGITESDIALATTSKAVLIGFNVRANREAKALAEQQGTEIRYYNIIYDLVDDIKAAMSGMLAPTLRENFLGNARALQIFDISKLGNIAGCLITEGKVERGAAVRLIRDNVVIHEGKLSTLRRFKDEVKEVSSGMECGMGFENYHDLKVGDVIECFRVETIQRSL